MKFLWLSAISLSAALASACSSSDGSAPAETVYDHMGGEKGVKAVVADFLQRVQADQNINGYFLNASLDTTKLGDCLVKQIGNATGGPQTYDCRNMKDAHANLSISQKDFDDLVSDLTEALKAAKVAQADIDKILGVLGPMADDIVKDKTSDGDIYQRAGRKPGIQALVTAFHTRVMGDTRIAHFFASSNAERLATCLVRQVCEKTGGPCIYGDEIPHAEPGVVSACQNMKDAHASLHVMKADFDALVEDLVAEIDAAGVSVEDRDAIVGVLAPLCTDIVEGGVCG
jgi:hemoglobin